MYLYEYWALEKGYQAEFGWKEKKLTNSEQTIKNVKEKQQKKEKFECNFSLTFLLQRMWQEVHYDINMLLNVSFIFTMSNLFCENICNLSAK